MRIMCLNGWGGAMHEPLCAYLVDADPDVLCLQEVVHTPDAPTDWLEYRDGTHILPQRANFFADVCASLPNHTATFCPAAQGVLWQGDKSTPSQWGLATFVRRTLPIIAQTQGFVHKGFEPMGYGDHPRSRSAHAVRIYDFDNDRPVTIAHMHGLRDLDGKMDTPERVEQAKRFRDLARQVAQPEDAFVLCGDFNVEPDSVTFDILRELDLTDLIRANGITSTRTDRYKKPGKFADYMLVNSHAKVQSFDVIRIPEVSDHCPLLLHL